MEPRNTKGPAASEEQNGRHEHPLRQEIKNEERKKAEAAHREADKDIENDPDLSVHSPNDDLDEGETARLGEDTSGII